MHFAAFTTRSPEETLRELKSLPEGLTETEASRRLGEHGPNELARHRVRWPAVLVRQFASPFLYLLVAAAVLAFFPGETLDAVMIAAFVVLNAGIGFIQEYQSERAVALLQTFVSSTCRVKRDGQEKEIKSRDVVSGDVLILRTGDLIRADARIIQAENFAVNETVLTGESVAVHKDAKELSQETNETFKAGNIVFAATTVVSGSALAVVIATGKDSEIGRVAKLTEEPEVPGDFAKGIARFSRVILWVIVVTLVVVFAANLLVKGDHANIPDLLIFSIALAVSVIPEALPIVITTTLSRGAVKLAKKKVVVKRLSAIEDLGSIEVLCTDKTGTLTENRLELVETYASDAAACLFTAALGSTLSGAEDPRPADSFDVAIWGRLPASQKREVFACAKSHETPFDPAKRWNSVSIEHGRDKRLIVRGAREAVMALCGVSSSEMEKAGQWSEAQGKNGRRVLAIASKKHGRGSVPRAEDGGLAFEGLLAFADPVKRTAKHAIAESRRLGVAVKILTGDSKEVAGAVAHEVGLVASAEEVMSGEEWSALSPDARFEAAAKGSVFARVSPEQKFQIIKTLQASHEVGFLGEGINDAPALKLAHVGIVVDSAADIAREAADIVLLKHSLEVIVEGIRDGREVFANTVKYIKATLTSNFGNFLAVAVSTLFIEHLPMLPIQLLLVNLLSDFPMIAIAADAVDSEELRRPRHYSMSGILLVSTVLGVVSTVFDFIFFALFFRSDPTVLQTNWFIGSILTELVLIFSIRTKKPMWRAKAPSSILLGLSAAAFILTILLPLLPVTSQLFRFRPPSADVLALILALVGAYFVVTEIVKRVFVRATNSRLAS